MAVLKWRLFAALPLLLLCGGIALAYCEPLRLTQPETLQSISSVTDYRSVLRICKGESGEKLALREMTLPQGKALLLADAQSLETTLAVAACWTCRDVEESALAGSRLMRAIDRSAEAPGVARRGFLSDAGLAHGQGGGTYFTGDLCPSRRPLERAFLETLAGTDKPTPIGLSISGRWLLRHFDDFRWLLHEQARGAFAITWIDHSFTHPYQRDVDAADNFLLSPDVDMDYEILDTERLLIANGQTPSLFFRFPGLVSSSPLMQAVRRHHLIALGANAWLALNQAPRDGSIVLVHPNGNEPRGLALYQRNVREGVLSQPLKPIEQAPE